MPWSGQSRRVCRVAISTPDRDSEAEIGVPAGGVAAIHSQAAGKAMPPLVAVGEGAETKS